MSNALSIPTQHIASARSRCVDSFCLPTPREKEFQKVAPGMEKDLVLEAAGNPNVTRRWNGKDRWIYEYKDAKNGNQIREVHFEDGKAVYVGDKVVPAVSAAEQDRLNDISNAKEDARTIQETRAWEKEHGVKRVQYKSEEQQRLEEEKARNQLAPRFESID